MMGNIQETIFKTVDIITEKKINDVKFDKTIEAIVTNDSSSIKGEYEVKYQDIVMPVFANNNTIKYKKDECVYILIPQGDFSNKKTIVGRKELRGEEFLDIKNMIDQVERLGDNYVINSETFSISLDSGLDQVKEIDFRKEDFLHDYENKINLLIGANITSDLINEVGGDFGIAIDLTYRNGVRYTYKLSIGSMTGNPYRLAGQYQYRVFSLLLEDAVTINGVYAYITGFKENSKNAVKFSNIEFVYVKPREAENLNQFTGKLFTPKGNVFKNGIINQEEELDLEMQLFKVGKIFEPAAVYKWFLMDSQVDSNKHPDWDIDGGLGWRALREDKLPEGMVVKEGGKILSVKPSIVPNFEVFKCVATFGGEKIELPGEEPPLVFGVVKVEAVETIVDQTDALNIVIDSTKGDVFKSQEQIVNTDLICKVLLGVDVISPTKFLYTWIKINDDNSQTVLSKLSSSEKLTVPVKDDIINTRNYICEVYLKE